MKPLKTFLLFMGVIVTFGLGLFVGSEVATAHCGDAPPWPPPKDPPPGGF